MCFYAKNRNKEPDARNVQQRNQRQTIITMNPSIPNYSDVTTSFPPQTKKRGRGNKIIVGTVVKSNVGDLEEDIREGFSRRLWKEMTGMVQEVVGNRRYLLRFQYGLKKNMSSKQLTILVVRSEVEEEIEVKEVEMIPEVS